MEKGGFRPHLNLNVETPDGLRTRHWSIRKQQFYGGHGHKSINCSPVHDFSARLTDNLIDKNVYQLGGKLYRIPTELTPVFTSGRVSIHSDILVGSATNFPQRDERITLVNTAIIDRIPEKHIPLGTIDWDSKNFADLLLKKRLSIWGVHEDTKREILIDCFRGPSVNKLCAVKVVVNGTKYGFRMPSKDLKNWSEATDKIIALFGKIKSDEEG